MELRPHQLEAIEKIKSGKILYGGVGSGKTATVLGAYVRYWSPKDLIVITTAKKRDSTDWEAEAIQFGISAYRDLTVHGTITVDSWNNIGKYADVEDAFFVFDEQRVVGTGKWTKEFIKIARKNDWVLLSATPGDTWLDYAPVFIANGFYKHITDFKLQHVVYEPWIGFPKVRGYLGERKLQMLRNDVLVEMPYEKHTTRFLNYIDVSYDEELFKWIYAKRWNPWENRPCKDMAEVWRLLRRVVNSHRSRLERIEDMMGWHPRLIVFYNFDYELDLLRTLQDSRDVFEWNGHVKDPLPKQEKWLYVVQYVAGAEAWNCTTTEAMSMYSLTYSYKNFEQAQGRIDRMDTPYSSLYYYILVSNSLVDRAIRRALGKKENFNERKFMLEFDKFGDVEAEFLESCQI